MCFNIAASAGEFKQDFKIRPHPRVNDPFRNRKSTGSSPLICLQEIKRVLSKTDPHKNWQQKYNFMM